MCEEMFGGELDVTEKTPEPFESEKSQVRQHRDWLHQLNERDWCSRQKVMESLKRMGNFCRSKKIFLPIGDGITKALREMQLLKEKMKRNDCYFEYHLRDKMVQKIKKVRSPKKVVLDESTQNLPEPAPRSIPESRMRLREPTVTPEVMAAEKPVEKRPKTSKHREEGVEVPLWKDLCKKKLKPTPKKPKQPKRARSEAVIMKPLERLATRQF